MNADFSNQSNRGAALIITLILVTAIALITVSFFSISLNTTKTSRAEVHLLHADLAERAAFESAKNLLADLTGNDAFVVSSVMQTNADGKFRYTFISLPSADDVTHSPLFSGGKTTSEAMPNLSKKSTASLTDSPIAAPQVQFDSGEKSQVIKAYRLDHLTDSGGLEAENQFPETILQDFPNQDGDKFQQRFSYWIEDLQGYPNLDVVGGWTDHYGDGTGKVAMDFIRPGYSAIDPRTDGGGEKGMRIPFPEANEYAFQFPKSFRGQKLTDQVAPGLSPREILLLPWETAGLTLQEHPFAKATSSVPSGNWSPIAGKSRFVVGLKPYRELPLIPFGHGYADEGQNRHNLNALVVNRSLSSSANAGGIYEVINRNLPNFDSGRRGGFPAEESYLATLGANIIDYADPDSIPALPGNAQNVGGYAFRGLDSYCVVNEFFVRFKYDGYTVNDDNFTIHFSATPYVEFWNTSNQPAALDQLTLDFRFLERVRFKSNGSLYEIKEDAITKNEPKEVPIAIALEPNQFLVYPFGQIEWQVNIPKPAAVAFPIIEDIRGYSTSRVRANYELLYNGIKIDSAGRAGPGVDPLKPEHGFFFRNSKKIINSGEHFMRSTAASLSSKKFGFGSNWGSQFGDPWMPYYSQGTAEETNYRNEATPGGRNFRSDKINNSRPDWFKDQARIRDWADRGFGTPPGSAPGNETVLPDQIPPPSHSPEFAPWRISNLGRFYSVTELGNLHDPHMWKGSPVSDGLSFGKKRSIQRFDREVGGSTVKEGCIWNLQNGDDFQAVADPISGGGNTLRIGRPEHEIFDEDGLRASQLLDLFHTGVSGSNLTFSHDAKYAFYDPRDHQPPPTAPNPVESLTKPYSLIYDPALELHAQSKFRLIYGHLNINSAPTLFEIETLLRGPFSTSSVTAKDNDWRGPIYSSPTDSAALSNSLREDSIPLIARDLYAARPFYSPSHLARVFSESMKRHRALPDYHNDAQAEETFARLFNTTTFSSRHFRIFTYGEVIGQASGMVLSRSRRVYEVYMREQRDAVNGRVVSVRLEVLSSRDL